MTPAEEFKHLLKSCIDRGGDMAIKYATGEWESYAVLDAHSQQKLNALQARYVADMQDVVRNAEVEIDLDFFDEFFSQQINSIDISPIVDLVGNN